MPSRKPLPPATPSACSRDVLNFALLVALALVFRLSIRTYADADLGVTEALSVLGIGGFAGAVYGALPAASRKRIERTASSSLGSMAATRVLVAGLAVLCLSTAAVTRVTIAWSGPEQIAVTYDGGEKNLFGSTETGDSKRVSSQILSWSFVEHTITCGAYTATITAYPLAKNTFRIPDSEVAATQLDIAGIEEQLTLSLFQFEEARHLDVARQRIAAAQNRGSTVATSVRMLDVAYNIFRLSLLDPDASNTKQLLLEEFRRNYPSSPWANVLTAIVAYGNHSYDIAAKALDHASSPRPSATEFFRGVCLMRDAMTSGASKKSPGLDAAGNAFAAALDLARREPVGYYRDTALPSALIFSGITKYYTRDLKSANQWFEQAVEIAHGGLKARALNDIGYVALTEARLSDAEIAFIAALEADPGFSYARSNYGYLLIALNRTDEARKIFEHNISDGLLAKESPRDVLLAKVALGHLMEISGQDSNAAIEQYAGTLREIGKPDYAAVSPPALRLAYLHLAVGSHVYLDKQFYGLEMFALAMFTRSALEATALSAETPHDARAADLLHKAELEIQRTSEMVNPTWSKIDLPGVFSSISSYMSARDK